ncbi:nuclease-related domain-containing protein [Paraliobacillus ryukyuensis]|uniref:nuclease-related domain-containing protein n=1 Tax=Paraliobacillus ryukyuensis TaxID=200904 RepID=UPI002118020C|nr:nuclease-related domain-containing protein [Paraliobacillus ryukyuensis]
MKILEKLFKKKETHSSKKINQKQKKSSNIKNVDKVAVRKGEIGEYKINIQLDQFPKEYKHLEDIMIENKRGKTGYSQIDHILITPYGLFVIETKNYEGTVYGGKDRKIWSVNGKFKMMNPFKQNYGHIMALKSLIEDKYHSYLISMVSFTKRCTFKIDDTELRKIDSNELLVYDIELSDYINRKVNVNKLQYKESLLTDNEIQRIYEQIKEANITDPVTRKQHIESLKEDRTNVEAGAKCKICDKSVSAKVKAYCLSNKKFKGEIYCYEHQKNM